MMNNYTIYVTEDIAKKAMEKGFEIFKFHYDDTLFNYYGTFPHFGNIDIDEYYLIPTVEQITNWIFENYEILPMSVYSYTQSNSDYTYWSGYVMEPLRYKDISLIPKLNVINKELTEKIGFLNRKDAILDAINKILEII